MQEKSEASVTLCMLGGEKGKCRGRIGGIPEFKPCTDAADKTIEEGAPQSE